MACFVTKNSFVQIAREERLLPARRCTSVPATWKPLPFRQDSDTTIPLGNLQVEVRNVSGDVLKFDVEGCMTVAMLKRELARHWDIPPICQQLAIGTTAISMDSKLPLGFLVGSQPSASEPTLSMVMVASAEYAVQVVLDSRRAEKQLEALHGLVHIAPHGGEAAIAAVIRCFSADNHDTAIRRAAVMALSGMIQQGAGIAIDELCSSCVWEPAPKIRLEALRALMHTAAEVDERVVVCLGRCLQDDDIHVRSEAINFIARAANADRHERIMSEIRLRLDDQHAFVRKAAVQCLARVAVKGDNFAVPLVIARLDDLDAPTRCAALHAVLYLVDKGNPTAIDAVGARLEDSSAEVRCAAVEALGVIAEKGESKSCALLQERLTDKDPAVRDLASEALRHLDPESSDRNLIFHSPLSWPPAHSWSQLPLSSDIQADGKQKKERMVLEIPPSIEEFMEQLDHDLGLDQP